MPGPQDAGSTPPAQAATGAVLVAGQNALVAAAPAVPGNSLGVGGPEVIALTGALNVIGQWVKMHDWFDQNRWMIPLLLVLSLSIAVVVWHDDLRRAILNGFTAVDTAVKNYGALNSVGVLPAGTDARKG